MSGWYHEGMWPSDEESPVDSLDLEANFAQIRGGRQEAGGSTAERAGLSPEQLAQAGQNLEAAQEHFQKGLDALNNLMHTLPPEQQTTLQRDVIPQFEAAAYELQDTNNAITPQ